jgi:serine protease Do
VLACCFTVAACDRPHSSLPNFADLVEDVSPAVVNISTVSDADPQTVGPAGDRPDEGPDEGAGSEKSADPGEKTPDWYKKYFDENPDGGPDGGDASVEPIEQSLGTGFILWEDGYILTNRHVVKDAKQIIARLSDRRQLPATVVGLDERSDLALLKIDASGLPAVKLGDIGKLRVGEWVLAIGSPFGFDYSATAGIVSAKGRSLISEQYVPYLQTDVAINPGNSGGPLFNTRGEVVGVNSQIFSETGGYMGVSFAIPIDVAAKAARQLRDNGKVTRGWLGVVVQEVDRGLAQSFGMKKPEGALVARIVAGGPASQAGIKVGDILLSYNGQDLAASSDLPPLVGNSDPGDKATLRLMREGKVIDVPIEVGTLDAPSIESAPVRAEPPAPGDLGIKVRSLTTEERDAEQIVSGGVAVVEIAPGVGRDAGLRLGDIILSLAGNEIDSPRRFAEVIGRLQPGQSAPLLVQRRGTPVFLALEIPARDTSGQP